MRKKLSAEEIQKKIREREDLEQRQLAKLEALRNKKKGEIEENINASQEFVQNVELTEEEEKKIIEVFKGKSLKEIQKILNKENNKEKMKSIRKKILTTLAILGITAGVGRGILQIAERDAKNKRQYEVKKPEKNPVFSEDIISLEKIQKNIPTTSLEEGITYEDIITAVTDVENKDSRDSIKEYLYAGDIVGLQKFLGMKENSIYTSNQTTGIIDQNTMERITPYLGSFDMEITNNPEIGQDVKDAYKEFLEGKIDYNNQNYLIISKDSCKVYLFDKNNRLINIQPVLIGKDIGNENEFMPYDHYYEDGQKIYHTNPINTNTPEGYFMAWVHRPLNSKDYIVDTENPQAINIIPINIKTKKYDPRFNAIEWKLNIHPTFKPKGNEEKYENALNSKMISDNYCSHGCPNLKDFEIIDDNITCDKENGSIVNITHYHNKKNPDK